MLLNLPLLLISRGKQIEHSRGFGAGTRVLVVIHPSGSSLLTVTHSVRIPLVFRSRSSPEWPPTAGYYCLINGRLGRRSPDKSIKLPPAVPKWWWGRQFCHWRENFPACTSSQRRRRVFVLRQRAESNNSRAAIFRHGMTPRRSTPSGHRSDRLG